MIFNTCAICGTFRWGNSTSADGNKRVQCIFRYFVKEGDTKEKQWQKEKGTRPTTNKTRKKGLFELKTGEKNYKPRNQFGRTCNTLLKKPNTNKQKRSTEKLLVLQQKKKEKRKSSKKEKERENNVKRSEQKHKNIMTAWILQVSQTGRQKNIHSLPYTPFHTPKEGGNCSSIIKSPRTRKVLSESAPLKTPEEEKETETLRALSSDTSEGLNQVNSSGSNEKRAVFRAFKSLAFGEKIRKANAKKSVGKLVNLGEKRISSSTGRTTVSGVLLWFLVNLLWYCCGIN